MVRSSWETNASISRRVWRGREQRLAARDDAHGLDEVGGLDVLEQEAGGAGAQRAEHVLVELEGGEHDHARARERRVVGACARSRAARRCAACGRPSGSRRAGARARARPPPRRRPPRRPRRRRPRASSSARKPARTSAWSSASSTVITPASLASTRQPPPSAGPDSNVPLERLGALAHPAQPVAGAVAVGAARAVVVDLDAHRVAVARDDDAARARRRAWRSTLVSASCTIR